MIKKIIIAFACLFSFQNISAQIINTNISNGIIFNGEPYLALNPQNNQNLVSAWMSMVFTGGQYVITIKTRASFDGGITWSNATTRPHFGQGYGSADVSMAFDKNGLLYLSYIDYKQTPDSGGIYITRSFDGGLSWDTPNKVFDMYDDANKRPIDRPWLVVDNSNTINAGTLYITTKPAPWIAPPNRNYFKVSTDSGYTWSTIANIDGGNHLVGNLIAQPMATPATTQSGKFCTIYPSYVTTQNPLPAYYFAYSSNKGQTFAYTTVIAAAASPLDSNLKAAYHLATHANDSNKMIFLLPSAVNGDADIMALHSNDGGQTWSNRIRVNDDAVGNGKDQDMVWGAYNEKGSLAITWRDRRDANANGFWNAGYDFYYTTSIDNGQTFSANQKMSSQFIPFDSVLTENGNDMMNCTYFGDTLYAVWGDTRNGKMNIYFTKTVASTNTNLGIYTLEGEVVQWQFFPNPANHYLEIQAENEVIGSQISVFDSYGKKMYTQSILNTRMKIDIQNLPKGVYFLVVGNHAKKFIKQ